jgi:mono/diheme cytochrome c family protein
MKDISRTFILLLQCAAVLLLAVVVFVGISILVGAQPVHALPEYTTRTGESCAACHVSPGGGGPRTLRGLLWAARGRPDQVPQLPGVLLAPGVEDGAELYEIACAGCHGVKSEGLFAMGFTGSGISGPAIRSFIVQGIPLLGMPAFEGQFEEHQLNALVEYLAGLAAGRIEPPPDSYPLSPAQFPCQHEAPEICGEF